MEKNYLKKTVMKKMGYRGFESQTGKSLILVIKNSYKIINYFM